MKHAATIMIAFQRMDLRIDITDLERQRNADRGFDFLLPRQVKGGSQKFLVGCPSIPIIRILVFFFDEGVHLLHLHHRFIPLVRQTEK